MMEEYQDLWVKGECVEKGARECAKRYGMIREFCGRWKRPFTVLDLGAHRGYFSVRLTEDFPECTAVAVELDPECVRTFELNESERVVFLNRRVSVADLQLLAKVEHFDLVMALSFIHHQGQPFDSYVETLRSLGDVLLMELAMEPTASGQKVVTQTKIPEGAEVIGENAAHFGTLGMRPLVAMYQSDHVMRQTFIGCQPHHYYEKGFESTVDTKRIDGRDWHRGINLQTYISMNGRWPERQRIRKLLHEHGRPPDGHCDLHPGNVILSGDAVHVIDGYDQHKLPYTEEQQWDALVTGESWVIYP